LTKQCFGAGGERVKESSTKSSDGWGDDDDPWAAIAAPAPTTSVRALNPSAPKSSVISGPRRPAQQAQHVTIDGVSSSGRGRGRAAPMKLGAQRIQRSSE
jgi:hypothetical protein